MPCISIQLHAEDNGLVNLTFYSDSFIWKFPLFFVFFCFFFFFSIKVFICNSILSLLGKLRITDFRQECIYLSDFSSSHFAMWVHARIKADASQSQKKKVWSPTSTFLFRDTSGAKQ